MNETPTSPADTEAQLTVRTVLIVIAQPLLTSPIASVTCTVNDPEPVGVPLTSPVVVFNDRPAGIVPTIEKV